jgi:hypothetical protein
MRRTFLGGVIGLCGLVTVGCGGGSGTPTSAPPAATPPVAVNQTNQPNTPPKAAPDLPPAKKWTVEELATAKPDVKMTATEWRKVTTSGQEWKQKYGGKVIELEGEVLQVSDPHGEGICIMFASEGKGLYSAMAYTTDRRLWEKVGVGSKAVVRGTPSNFGGSIGDDLRPAVLVSADPHPAPALSAVDLAKEVATDAEATEKKYEKKRAFVTGEFVQYRPSKENDGRGQLILKGSGEVEVRVYCDAHDAKAGQALKPGTKIKAYGEIYASKARGDDKAYVAVSGYLFKAE